MRKLQGQLRLSLSQGLQPRQLALALTVGAIIGLLPTIWGTSLFCVLLAWLCRLNQLLVQLANYLVYPLQVLLFVPYFKFGETLFGGRQLPENLELLLSQFRSTPLLLLEHYWQANLQAICAWLLTTPLLLASLFPLALLLVSRVRPAQNQL